MNFSLVSAISDPFEGQIKEASPPVRVALGDSKLPSHIIFFGHTKHPEQFKSTYAALPVEPGCFNASTFSCYDAFMLFMLILIHLSIGCCSRVQAIPSPQCSSTILQTFLFRSLTNLTSALSSFPAPQYRPSHQWVRLITMGVV